MSGSKDWNDLDAGGDKGKPPKRGARPDLQEKMRRRFQNRNPESSSENTSPVLFEDASGRTGAFRQVPEGAAASSGEPREKQRGRGETPVLNDPDANGNFMFHDGHNSDLGKSRTSKSQGRKLQDQGASGGQDHLDKALNSVIGELDRDDMSHKGKKSQGGSEAVFENNFDDVESPQAFNIPAGGGVFARSGPQGGNSLPQGSGNLKRGHGRKVDKKDDEMMGNKQEQHQAPDAMQEMLRSLMGGGQNVNEREDPLAALFGGQPGGNGGMGGLFGDGENPLAALMGNRGGDRNDNENPMAALLAGGGRDPLANMMGGGAANSKKNKQNFDNDLMSSLVGDQNKQRKENVQASRAAKKRNGHDASSEDESSSEDEDEDDDSSAEETPFAMGQGKDPIRAMLDEMTKDMEVNASPLAAKGASKVGGDKKREPSGLGQMRGVKGAGQGSMNPLASVGNGDRQGGGGNPFASMQGGSGNPPAALMGGNGRGKGGGVEAGGNPLAALMGGAGSGRGEPGGNPLAALMGEGSHGDGGNPLAALMGGRGSGGGESGGNPLAALMGEGSHGDGGNPLAALMGGMGSGGGESGGNPLAALMGGRGSGGGESGGNPLAALMGGRGSGGGESGGNPLAALMGGNGGGMGGGVEAGGNPLAALMGGGGNPLAALMGGGGRSMGGVEGGGDPLAALMGRGGRGRGGPDGDSMASLMGGRGGGNPLAGLMGGQGRGGGSGGLPGMFGGGGTSGGGGGDQMSQALASIMGGAGRGSGGNPMASLMSSLGGGGGGSDGPQQQLLRQMMGQAGISEEDELTPENAGDNEIMQQLLAYESMRAQSSRAPRADNAMSTIIVVDTSGSMDGQPLIEAGQFISQFINGLEELQFEYNLQENVALVCVGGETQVVQHFTNDYSLIRQATDSLSASGSSRLQLGLLLPIAVLHSGGPDSRNEGGICNINGHLACPRVIFISDGYPTTSDDIPGHQPRPDDKMTLALQNLCVELTQTVTQRTLCKVYCVPVGNSNLNFMEMLSSTTGGRVMQSTDAKHMSHCLLHHNLVAKLRENSQKEPTRAAVAELLKQVTATADEDDINGVFEVIREGEPDVQARDARVAQEMMQGRGRGRGRGGGGGGGGGGGMQGMEEMAALMGQGRGQMPGGLQSMMGMAGGGGRGRGFPSLMGRGRPGGGMPMMTEGGGGLGGIQAMLGMAGNMGQGGGQGRGMDSLMGMGRGGGGLEGLMGGMGRGGGGLEGLMGGMGRGGGGLEGLMGGMGRGGGGLEGLMGGMGRGGGGLEGLMGGMGRGGGDAAGGLGGLPSMGQGGSGNQGNNLEALFNMSRGGRDQRDGDGLALGGMGQGAAGSGFGSAGKGPDGGGDRNAFLGMGRKPEGNEGQGNRGGSQAGNSGLEPVSGQANGAGEKQTMLGMGGGDNQNEQQNVGIDQMSGAGPQAMLGRGNPNPVGEKKSRNQGDAIRRQMLGLGNAEEENEQGKSLFSHLPGGSLHAMLGMGDLPETLPGAKKEGDKGQGKDRKKSKKSRSGKGPKQGEGAQPVVGDEDGSLGQFQSKEDETEQGAQGGLGLLSGDGSKGAEAAEGNDIKHKKKKKGRKTARKNSGDNGEPSGSGKVNGNPEIGGSGNADEPRNVPPRQNQRGSGLFNNVPPMSFGLDEHGKAHFIDLMGGLGDNDKEGEELMAKLSELLENSDLGDDGEEDDNDNNDENQGERGGLLRGLPDILGLGGRRAGGIPGMPGNRGNQPQNIGGPPPNIRDYLQNMGRESMGQNIGGARDEDGDVIMGGLGGMGQRQGGAPFAGLGGIGGGNLPFGVNRGQQGAPMPQGFGQAPENLQQLEQILQNAGGDNQGMPSVEQLLAQLGMGGMGNLPGGQNPFGGQG
ncbi:uncharacterized PE-PGRS family protein PE_PGRS54-like isoform X3 [Ruditapes philippinarum]|uniref:uncharacterized PE-PGRS family protein PE_PGRS54-like isoform X3 n=1 Tax=Ruditapes philippinarum TaxID=129788 RepID=UPI00295B085F|nr:uncharacterized PE-PGRS family protein PE_PGRS54-like isoform X3 [Ruditapes philippinarum]